MARFRARVSGRVQGVGFRASVLDEARGLGLVGWVKNEHDGSVLLEAQGERPALDLLLAWCHEGPRGARVTGVRVEWVAEMAEETSFRVRF